MRGHICFVLLLCSGSSVESKILKNYTEIASDKELEQISQELFELGDAALLSHITLNLQGRQEIFNSTEDLAPEPLLTLHDDFVETETMRYMQMLFDNFERNASVEETVSAEELEEERDFINAILKTTVMRRAMTFLESKNLVQSGTDAHYDLIKTLWFEFYPRSKGRNVTSSGFEHVFLVEIKKKKLIGLHNWVYFAAMERNGALNYKGWERIVDLGNRAKILALKFNLDGMRKNLSSLFIGTTPELELALYTICFKLRTNRRCTLACDGVKFNLTTYSLFYDKKKFVASAYVLV